MKKPLHGIFPADLSDGALAQADHAEHIRHVENKSISQIAQLIRGMK